ncbi:hypothetical protein BCA64_23345 [Salmonella enterica subsp. enterica serovar Enteritidis]|uniref:Uncharacterized protein n=2 Tax=root TaxID=1 RepID=S4SGI4_9CAUD|nr:hypothetical protein [Salmonella enterica]YP_009608621.1 hypothetical protein FDI18_gp66 [Salmonella phage vB_SenS_AG11]EDU5318948.1 hypothetical protein [Salmonella enterica subsp. enterica serovar Saintpaul]WPH65178.1 hypothetical protein CPTAKMCE_061 [Salmonella phage vB_SenM-AKM_CE]AFO12466.1 hypothetical protein [Salmonella phage vB_SenS_AG11]EAN8354659.1 hypothetical protein [Salmonella enterica]EAU9153833.1 hypothetical protein [Salmonella enterica]
MGTKFEVIDENTVTVPEEGSHYILIDKVNGGWRAKAYFNGGAIVVSKGVHTSFTSAYDSLKDAVKSAANHLSSVEL